MTLPNLTPDSLELFTAFAVIASDFSNCPWVSECVTTKAQRGNLSDLVKKGFLTIEDYEGLGRSGDMYVMFEDKGVALGQSLLGIDLSL
jgi:hypothetical protein